MPKTTVEAYLNFNGRCEEAVEFYCRALGAEVDALMRFKDSPEPGECPPGNQNKIMHACFRIGATSLMASDCEGSGQPAFQGISLCLNLADKAEARQRFDALAEEGKVEMPLAKTFWSPLFGVVSDRFGVSWMVNVSPESSPAQP